MFTHSRFLALVKKVSLTYGADSLPSVLLMLSASGERIFDRVESQVETTELHAQ